MKVLGVDASSKTVALSLIEKNKEKLKLLQSNFYQPDKNLNILNKLKSIKENVLNLIKDWEIPDFIYIEDIILYMKGGSTAQTVTTLAATNRVVGLTLFEYYNLEPNLISVLSVRHKLKLDKKLPDKKEIPLLLESHLDQFKFPWIFEEKESGKRKKKKQIISEINYDISDSIATGIAGLLIQKDKK